MRDYVRCLSKKCCVESWCIQTTTLKESSIVELIEGDVMVITLRVLAFYLRRKKTGARLSRETAILPHLLAVEPQPDGEGNAEENRKAREQRVAAAVPERGVHLLAEEREGEAEHRAEDGGGGEGGRGVGEGVDEVQLYRQAGWITHVVSEFGWVGGEGGGGRTMWSSFRSRISLSR